MFFGDEFCIISDDSVVKAGLPHKWYIVVPCVFCDERFEPRDDMRQSSAFICNMLHHLVDISIDIYLFVFFVAKDNTIYSSYAT